MEFPFEALEVYQKSLELYRRVSRPGSEANRSRMPELKRGVVELCQSIVTGAGTWNKETKVRCFLQALDQARCLVPLVECARMDDQVAEGEREELRERIEALSRMLSSLARKTREWADKGGPEGGAATAPVKPPVKPKSSRAGTEAVN